MAYLIFILSLHANVDLLTGEKFNLKIETDFPDIGKFLLEITNENYTAIEQNLDRQTSVEMAKLIETIDAFMFEFVRELQNLTKTNTKFSDQRFSEILLKHFPTLTPDTIAEILKLDKIVFVNNLMMFPVTYKGAIAHEVGHNLLTEISNTFFKKNRVTEKNLIVLKISNNINTIDQIVQTIISTIKQNQRIIMPITGVSYSTFNKNYDRSDPKYKPLQILIYLSGIISQYHNSGQISLDGSIKDFENIANFYLELNPLPNYKEIEHDLTSFIYLAYETILINGQNSSTLSKIIASKSYILDNELRTFYKDSPVIIPLSLKEFILSLEEQNMALYIPSNRDPVFDEKFVKPVLKRLKEVISTIFRNTFH